MTCHLCLVITVIQLLNTWAILDIHMGLKGQFDMTGHLCLVTWYLCHLCLTWPATSVPCHLCGDTWRRDMESGCDKSDGRQQWCDVSDTLDSCGRTCRTPKFASSPCYTLCCSPVPPVYLQPVHSPVPVYLYQYLDCATLFVWVCTYPTIMLPC